MSLLRTRIHLGFIEPTHPVSCTRGVDLSPARPGRRLIFVQLQPAVNRAVAKPHLVRHRPQTPSLLTIWKTGVTCPCARAMMRPTIFLPSGRPQMSSPLHFMCWMASIASHTFYRASTTSILTRRRPHPVWPHPCRKDKLDDDLPWLLYLQGARVWRTRPTADGGWIKRAPAGVSGCCCSISAAPATPPPSVLTPWRG